MNPSNEQLAELPTFEQLIEKLTDAKNIDELLTDEVRELYRKEVDGVRRASIAGELRKIARNGEFTKIFDRALSTMEKEAKDYEKGLIEWDKASTRKILGSASRRSPQFSKSWALH